MTLQKVSHFYSELQNSSIQKLRLEKPEFNQIDLHIKRDDQLHPIISGNKWRKLKHLLLHIESLGIRKIAVMGGAYSNLLHTLSFIGNRLGWSVELFVRGHPEQKLTTTLKDVIQWGAKITYISRIDFQKLRKTPPSLESDIFWITEGGFHELALKGTAESLMELASHYDYIIMATATGISLAGLAYGVKKQKLNSKVIGISVLKNSQQVIKDIKALSEERFTLPELISGYEFGGYAKKTPELSNFIKNFQAKYAISLEPTYSGKAFYATMDLIKKGYFGSNHKILLIHCGGLQAS